MATIAEHRAAIASALSDVFTTTETFDHELKKFPAAARFVVSFPESFDPDAAYGGRTVVYPVRYEIPWDHDESTDDALEAAMQAVADTVHNDPTLGGVVDSARCLPFTNIGAAVLPDETRVLQFVVPVEVFD